MSRKPFRNRLMIRSVCLVAGKHVASDHSSIVEKRRTALGLPFAGRQGFRHAARHPESEYSNSPAPTVHQAAGRVRFHNFHFFSFIDASASKCCGS
jgi:hypothetical protein